MPWRRRTKILAPHRPIIRRRERNLALHVNHLCIVSLLATKAKEKKLLIKHCPEELEEALVRWMSRYLKWGPCLCCLETKSLLSRRMTPIPRSKPTTPSGSRSRGAWGPSRSPKSGPYWNGVVICLGIGAPVHWEHLENWCYHLDSVWLGGGLSVEERRANASLIDKAKHHWST